ncbi:MAG TPA: formate dehydrogenase subunit alpha [Rectinemataceae bacterium]|nr:formate dehydrogenase subunit alpha [Rectinemataceae bacterium]
MEQGSKVEIRIDGRLVEAERGELLLPAARRAGVDIPSLCWHPRISPTGACRLCLVKIEGTRGLVTSCSTTVIEGMSVTAFDEELEEARRFVLSSLLSEVELGSDGSHHDEFEELCARYGLEPGRAAAPSRRERSTPGIDRSSPVLDFDPGRCIKCFRCVKACEEIQGKSVLSMIDRGLGSRIAAGESRWSDSECDGCGECVQLCPTGALVEKPYRAELRAASYFPGMSNPVRTTCTYCGVGCQIDLHVLDGRVVRVEGAEGILPNDGRLCVKGRFGNDFLHSPERLTTPLIREGSGFRRASWDEALDAAARGFLDIKKKHGPEALAGYASAKCSNEENYLFQKLVRIAFQTNNLDYCTRLCHASTVTAMLRSLGDGAGSNSIEDFETSDCVLVIGNNMVETHPVTATYLKRGRARGARLVVIDPRWTALADRADVWLQPRLGSDVALLNGMARIAMREGWVDLDFVRRRVSGGMESYRELERRLDPYTPERVREICAVEPEPLREATRLYATSPTAIIATGMGMSQQTVGTNNVFALINLMLVTGQIGKPRSGIDPPRGQNNVQGATDVGCSPIYYPGYIPASDEANRARVAALWGYPAAELPGLRGLTTVEIMKAAGEGRVKGLYIMGENPLHTDPNLNHAVEAIEALELLVVQDIFMTPTAERADIVLPAAAFAEKEGSVTNSDRRVLRMRKAVEPPGEARPDSWILEEIALRMARPIGPGGRESHFPGAGAVWDEIAQAAPIFGGIRYERIERQGIQWPCPEPSHPGTPTLFLERFNTEDGLARIVPVDYEPQSETPDAEYPFVLNTGRILYQYHSSTLSLRSPALRAFAGHSYVLVNPGDADRLGLAEGERVRIRSRRGALETRTRLDGGVAPGELFMPFHFPEALVNRLTRDELDPSSKIAPFKYSVCTLEKL